MTEIDDITQQLTRSAGHALHAARQAIDQHRQRNTRQRDEARREREHRLRVFETQLRTATLQRREAARQGNTQLAEELSEIDDQQRTDELIARWAAAEACRDADPAHADAWTARLREAGIDPEIARARADEIDQQPSEFDNDPDDIEQLATDYTEAAADLTDQYAPAEVHKPAHATEVDDGAETARLIGIAQPAGRAVGSVGTAPIQLTPATRGADLDHAAGL